MLTTDPFVPEPVERTGLWFESKNCSRFPNENSRGSANTLCDRRGSYDDHLRISCCFHPRRQLRGPYRPKRSSAVEAVEAHLRRIDEVNPRLNAVVKLAGDRAIVGSTRGGCGPGPWRVAGCLSWRPHHDQGLPRHRGHRLYRRYAWP